MLKKFLSKLLGSKETAPAAKKKPARKPARAAAKKTPAASAKKSSLPAGAQEIGRVVAFFRIPVVAVIRATKQSLKAGDRIWIKGHTTNIKMTASSLQVDHQPVFEVKKGKEAGLKLPSRARLGDRVYRLSA